MTPAADEISDRLSHFFADVPEQAFHNAQIACQQHLHRLMADALESRDGDIESNPEVRSVIRAIFQLSVLRKSSPLLAHAGGVDFSGYPISE
ncbi:hypothetical protein F8B91_02515 [Aestuariivirga litoralis]|nr:hypothetical protein [Aestuariivirga litoralis]